VAKIYHIRLNNCAKRQSDCDDIQLQKLRIVNSSVSFCHYPDTGVWCRAVCFEVQSTKYGHEISRLFPNRHFIHD